MSASLSSVPAVLKLNHAHRDSVATFEDGSQKPYSIPLKQYQTNNNAPTLGDILRGAETITSITFNSSVFHKFTDTTHQDSGESRSLASRESAYFFRETPTNESPSYSKLLSATANARPRHQQSAASATEQTEEYSENLADAMKLKGSKAKMKDTFSSAGSKESKNNMHKKGRRSRSRKRSKSAVGRSKGQSSVVDRLYQVPQNSGTKTPVAKQDGVEVKPKQQVIETKFQNNGLGLGSMQITLCKPITIHNNRPERRETKSEVPRKSSERVCTAISSKSLTQQKNIENGRETVTLPQMINSAAGTSLVKSVTQAEILRKTSNCFSPMTQKLPVHMGSSAVKVQSSDNSAKVTKVYLSDKHSGTVKDCGIDIPCAPPATPTPDQLRKVEYIPSLNDIRSQRAVRVKLQVLEKEAQKKFEKEKEEKEKLEKQNRKMLEKDLKHQQRLEIYALNKVMTDLELSRFKEFCAKKGIKTS